MAKQIVVDKVDVVRLVLYKEPSGEFNAYAEYHVKQGAKVVQTRQENITQRLAALRKNAAQQVFDAIATDISDEELR